MNEPHFVAREGAIASSEYLSWLAQVKQQYRSSQAKAAVRVNSAMLEFYWTLGRDICALRAETKWGSGFFSNLSIDLQSEFPGQKGFSVTNLKYIKRWYQFYHNQLLELGENRHQPVDDLANDINALFPIAAPPSRPWWNGRSKASTPRSVWPPTSSRSWSTAPLTRWNSKNYKL